MYILLIIVIVFLTILCFSFYKKSKIQIETNNKTIQINKEIKEKNNQLNKEQDLLNIQITNLTKQISDKTKESKDIDDQISAKYKKIADISTRCVNLEDELEELKNNLTAKAQTQADKENQEYLQKLKDEYQIVVKDLVAETDMLLEQYQKESDKIVELKKKQDAYIKEQQHKEEMMNNKDYYRLVISKDDIVDIQQLREVQHKINKKEAIDKVIWTVYYKPAYDILMSHIFKDDRKICGIYKITNITTQKAYIGQSVDIKNRFKEHINQGISISPSTNKLYKEMKIYLPEDFLFEVLEEVARPQLNEREVYWIDMFKTKEYGMNVSRGG